MKCNESFYGKQKSFMWVAAILCVIFLGINPLMAFVPSSYEEIAKMSEDDQKSFFKKISDELADARKEKEQREKKLLEAKEKLHQKLSEEKRTTPKDSNDNSRSYQIDPLFKKAWLEYRDWNNRNREEVAKLFQQYIDKDPNSIFMPEIYYRLGSMYSNNRNPEKGETLDIDLRNKYWKRASALYGGLFSIESMAIGSFISDDSLQSRKLYYEHLTDFIDNGGPEDIFPIQNIGLCVEGYSPELNIEQRKDLYKRIKPTIPSLINEWEKLMFRKASYIDLLDIAYSYSGSELEKQARERLKVIDSKIYYLFLEKILNGTFIP